MDNKAIKDFISQNYDCLKFGKKSVNFCLKQPNHSHESFYYQIYFCKKYNKIYLKTKDVQNVDNFIWLSKKDLKISQKTFVIAEKIFGDFAENIKQFVRRMENLWRQALDYANKQQSYFEFQPVGQGLFYTGSIKSQFNFVYDCGSEEKINQKVIDQCFPNPLLRTDKNAQKTKINILFISHFHDDHISGIPYLLTKYSVDRIILPYYPTWILNILDKEINILSGGKKSSCLKDVTSKIEKSDNSKKLYLIIDNEDFEKEKGRSIKEVPLEIFGINFEKDDSLKLYKDENEHNVFYLANYKNIFDFSIKDSKIGWTFDVFSKKISFSKIRRLNNHINKIIKAAGGLEEALKEEKWQSALRESYKEVDADINNLSLMVKHWPDKHPNIATLLTGDQNLNSFTPFIRPFDTRCRVVLIPHHGSERSFNLSVLKSVVSDFQTVFAVSYGFSNIYGHPNMNNLVEVARNLGIVAHANEKSIIRYRIENDIFSFYSPMITASQYWLDHVRWLNLLSVLDAMKSEIF